MIANDIFLFDAELIEQLREELDLDACGVGEVCRDERCPCWRLGLGGEPISVGGSDATGWWFRTGAPTNGSTPYFDTLEEAVRACQNSLRGA